MRPACEDVPTPFLKSLRSVMRPRRTCLNESSYAARHRQDSSRPFRRPRKRDQAAAIQLLFAGWHKKTRLIRLRRRTFIGASTPDSWA